MAKMSKPLSDDRPSNGIRVLVVLALVSLVLVTVYYREGSSGPLHVARGAVQTVAAPFEFIGSQLARPFDALSNAFTNLTADEQTLTELEQQNETLTEQLAQLNEYRAENEQLESILGLSSAYALQGVGARVIGLSDDQWTDTITIDKGATSGIRLDMPVTIGTGVIGQVTSVSATSATVTLITDPNSGVSATLQDSRQTGILTGSIDGSLKLNYISTDVDVSVGEIVVTSGLGGTYPQGLPLGTVTSTTPSVSGGYRDITVEPIANASNYGIVYVITSFETSTDTDTTSDDTTDATDDADNQVDEGGE